MSEQEIARDITQHLLVFNSLLAGFRDALALFEFCDSEPARQVQRSAGWRFIAGRDGAMAIWHFYRAMEEIRSRLDSRTCPTLVGLIDFDATRRALRMLRDSFPNYEDLRHSVAHAGEIAGDPRAHAARLPIEGMPNFAVGLTGTISFQNDFIDRRFVNTFEGQVQSYELSHASLVALDRAKRVFFSAFARAGVELSERLAAASISKEGS